MIEALYTMDHKGSLPSKSQLSYLAHVCPLNVILKYEFSNLSFNILELLKEALYRTSLRYVPVF